MFFQIISNCLSFRLIKLLCIIFQPGQDHRLRDPGHRRVPRPVLRVLLLLPVLPPGEEETARTSPQAGPGISAPAAASATSTSTTAAHAPATANGHAAATSVPSPAGLPAAAGIPGIPSHGGPVLRWIPCRTPAVPWAAPKQCSGSGRAVQGAVPRPAGLQSQLLVEWSWQCPVVVTLVGCSRQSPIVVGCPRPVQPVQPPVQQRNYRDELRRGRWLWWRRLRWWWLR